MSKYYTTILILILAIVFTPQTLDAQKTYKKKKKDPKQTMTFGKATTSKSKSGKREVYWENGKRKRVETLNDKLFRQGEYTEWYENGKLRTEEQYENGRKVGPCKGYYDSGNLHTSYNYSLMTHSSRNFLEEGLLPHLLGYEESGVLDGKVEEYFESGQIKKRYTYEMGKVDGEYFEWYENGQVFKTGQVIEKFNAGEYKEYHENGTTKLTGEYVRNQPVGKWVATHDNGQNHYVELYNTNNSGISSDRGRRVDGSWQSFHPNGEIEEKGQYKNGRQDSVWVEYHNNKQEKSIVKYKHGQRMGMYVEFYASGTKKIQGEYGESVADINRSRKEGLWNEWYENGQKMRSFNYKDGRREGPASEWYANGNDRLRTTFVYGGRKESMYDGITEEWHENGQLKYKGLYDKGRRDGEFKEYNDEGILDYEAYYDKNALAGRVTKYYANGNKMSEGEYKMTRKQRKTGDWIEWHENGEKKFLGAYINGKRKGVIFEYYDNGQLSREAIFEDDIIVGFIREFYPDGSKKIDGAYCDDYSRRGLKCGKWQVWDQEGNMIKDEVYENGKKIN